MGKENTDDLFFTHLKSDKRLGHKKLKHSRSEIEKSTNI